MALRNVLARAAGRSGHDEQPRPKEPLSSALAPPVSATDELALSRRAWYLVAAFLLVIGVVLRQPLLFGVAVVAGALGAIPEIWYRHSLRDVAVTRRLTRQRAEIGDELTLELRVENRKFLPLPHLTLLDDIPDETPIPGVTMGVSTRPGRRVLENVLAPWSFQRITRRYRVRCLKRGVWSFGPLTVESSDPFGLLTREARIERPAALLVYPLVFPLEELGLPARALLGDHRAPRRLLEDPLRVTGVRSYVAGDDPRHIHWKATARTGALQTKVLETSAHATLAIFLDVRTYREMVAGYDEGLAELAICVAASVARWGLDARFAVGLYANGALASFDERTDADEADGGAPLAATFDLDPTSAHLGTNTDQVRLRVPPGTDRRQLVRIEESLARLVPYFAGSIADVVAREEGRLPFGTTVVYIGAASVVSQGELAVLRRLRRHGHAVTLLLTGDAELDVSDLRIVRLGGAARWDTIYEQALAARGLDRNGNEVGHQSQSERDATVEAEVRP